MSNRRKPAAERLDQKTRSEMKKAEKTQKIDSMLETLNDLNKIEKDLISKQETEEN